MWANPSGALKPHFPWNDMARAKDNHKKFASYKRTSLFAETLIFYFAKKFYSKCLKLHKVLILGLNSQNFLRISYDH